MNKKYITYGVIGVLVLYIIFGYNGLVKKEEAVNKAWSDVENVYQRRADLIPNLVATVKGYASHEKETLTGVIEARAKATSIQVDANNLNPEALQKFQQTQGQLTQALSKLMVVVERYPDLKANENFSQLQSQLEGTENRIAVERRKFNESAKGFNTKLKKFPTNVLNKMYGFDEKSYFKAQEGSEIAPTVSFE